MSTRIRALRAPLAILAVVALFTGAIAFFVSSSAQAQLPTDFNLSISDGGLPAAGGNSDVTLAINPGESAIAAVGALISYDSAAIAPTGCVVLVGLGACNIDAAGVVNVQTVDPAGWTGATDLFRISFTSVSLDDSTPLDIEVTEAYDVTSRLIAGVVDDGEITLRMNGDVNCSGTLTVSDSLFIAQFSVGTRFAVSSCPLDALSEINTTWADVSGEGTISILDAVLVAQCSVSIRDCEA